MRLKEYLGDPVECHASQGARIREGERSRWALVVAWSRGTTWQGSCPFVAGAVCRGQLGGALTAFSAILGDAGTVGQVVEFLHVLHPPLAADSALSRLAERAADDGHGVAAWRPRNLQLVADADLDRCDAGRKYHPRHRSYGTDAPEVVVAHGRELHALQHTVAELQSVHQSSLGARKDDGELGSWLDLRREVDDVASPGLGQGWTGRSQQEEKCREPHGTSSFFEQIARCLRDTSIYTYTVLLSILKRPSGRVILWPYFVIRLLNIIYPQPCGKAGP